MRCGVEGFSVVQVVCVALVGAQRGSADKLSSTALRAAEAAADAPTHRGQSAGVSSADW